MTTLPIQDVSLPSCLDGQENGRLDPAILVSTPGQAGGSVVRLVAPAARAWRAMCAAGLHDGHVLKATSAADSYRTYEQQETIFRARYTTTYLPGRPSRLWNGRRWYQKPGTAAAAVPGTSNHGRAIAVDTGEERDGDAGAESLDQATLDWMLAHADKFGFSWELQSEPWHVRYFAGDQIPAAVLAYEAHPLPSPPSAPMIGDDMIHFPSFGKPTLNGRVPFYELRPVDGDTFLVVSHNGAPLLRHDFDSPSGLWTMQQDGTTGVALGIDEFDGRVFVACAGDGTYQVSP